MDTYPIAQAALDGEWAAEFGYDDENEAAEYFGYAFFTPEHSLFTSEFRKVQSCS